MHTHNIIRGVGIISTFGAGPSPTPPSCEYMHIRPHPVLCIDIKQSTIAMETGVFPLLSKLRQGSIIRTRDEGRQLEHDTLMRGIGNSLDNHMYIQ